MEFETNNGILYFSGHNTLDLAKKYKTPLYVMSQDIFEEKINLLKDGFNKTGIDYKIYFAGKSFLNKGICYLVNSLNLYLDTVSGGEIYTALEANFPPERIAFHGSNKSEDEIRFALDKNIGLFIIDSLSELEKVNQIASEMNKKVSVLIRVNPGVEAHTHELINTGKIDTKFGVPIEEVIKLLNRFDSFPNIVLKGFHCHIGSQIIDEEPFLLAAQKIFNLLKVAQDNHIETIEELNLGGGFGIAYTEKGQDFNPEKYLPKLIEKLKEVSQKQNIKFPIISIEPGRFISAPSGITLYTVGTIKDIPGIRTYLSVDGGLTDNPRPALYDADYEALICNRVLTEENAKKVRICGRACESDQLIDEIELADPQEGDILAVLKTGAYNYSMSSNYNRVPKPAVVLLNKDQSEILVQREDYSDLTRKDQIPYWLVDLC